MNRLSFFRGDHKQREVCKKLNIKGLDAAMLSRFENGQCNPSIPIMERLTNYYGVDVFDLYDKADLDYSKLSKKRPSKPRTISSEDIPFKLTIRCPKTYANTIDEQMRALSLKTQARWLEYAVKAIDREIEKAASAGTETASSETDL